MRDRALGGIVSLFLLSLACGCATISRGNRQTVEVVTDPPGATLEVNKKMYVTPAKVLVKRQKKYEVIVSKPGYQGIRFILHPRWDAGGVGAVAMDAIVPGGSVMFIVDTLAGADREFNKIATIKLPPATAPTTQVITLYEHKGHLYEKAAYKEAVERDKLFAKKAKEDKKKKKTPTTKPAKK